MTSPSSRTSVRPAPSTAEPGSGASRIIGLLLLLGLAAAGAARATSVIRSDDAWLHLASGREVVQRASLPETDLFLQGGEGKPWLLHSWLSEVVFYGLMTAGGLPWLMALRAVLLLTALGLLVLLLRRLGSPGWLAALLALAALVLPGIRPVLMRPLLFSHLLLIVYLFVLIEVFQGRRSTRALWVLPVLMVPWANLHAGHLLGVALGALLPLGALLDRLRGRAAAPGRSSWVLFLMPVMVLVAGLINPYGASLFRYAFELSSVGEYQGQVWEWVGFSARREPGLAALMAAGFATALWRWRRLCSLVVVAGLFLMLLPLVATRFLFHGAVGAALVLGAGLLPDGSQARALMERPWPRRLAEALTLGCLIAATVVSVRHGRGFRFQVDDRFFPVGAVRFMERVGLDGRILNYREWGGYLLWHRPGQRVFVDGRVEVSAGSIIEDYLRVAEARPGYGHVLDRWRIEILLCNYQVFRPSPDFPVQPTALDGKWSLVYFDDVALVYVRRSPRLESLVERHGYQGLVPSASGLPFRPEAPRDLLWREAMRAWTLAPSERAATYLGLLALANKDPAQAETWFSRALAIAPGSARTLNNLGVAVMRRGDRRRARALFEQVLDLEPTHKNALKNLQKLE